MINIFAALEEENEHDPIVHAHLTNYWQGKVSERDMLIDLVKDLSKTKDATLTQMTYLLSTRPPVPIYVYN